MDITKNPIHKFICDKCNFKSNNKKDYNNHINTIKHKKLTNTDEISHIRNYKCICGNHYKHRQSLYNHKKKCNYKEEENIKCEIIENNEIAIIKELKDIILKQQQQISELIPKVGNNY